MIEINKRNIIIFSLVVVLGFFAGVFFAKLYQPQAKTMQIYSHALRDYDKGDYSNSYYLFSRVGFLSNLKPVAVYRQALCAKELGDNKTAVKQLRFLLRFYPRHKLNVRSMYMAAQLLLETNPHLAQKYLNHIIEHHAGTDYAIAAEYYSGVLLMNKYKNRSMPASVRTEIENYFRHYLKAAPAGRLALQAVQNWLAVNPDINKDDYLLMGKSYYLFSDYKKAKTLLEKSDYAESWAVDVQNSYALNNIPRVKFLTEYGVGRYPDVDENDFKAAVNIYLGLSNSKFQGAEKLLSLIGDKKNSDYITNLKCEYSDARDKSACYSSMYVKYPNSKYASDALSEIFLSKIRQGSLEDAKKIGKDYLARFSNTNNAPMVMYWMGKLYQKTNNYTQYSGYYKSVISKYPDSYYAYRSYLKLNAYATSVFSDYISPKHIEYPYKRSAKNEVILKLVDLRDYEMASVLEEDKFIKSWILYKKGEYSASMLLARDAMDDIKDKPDKYDLRWRLVYPLNYTELIKTYSGLASNNFPLMMALVREESYFNPNAESAVGAKGLMQVMPFTAAEINRIYGLKLASDSDLFNPERNVEIGNYYYARIKSMLNGQDVSAIAAYNGGIGSVNTWKKSLMYADTDDFVEQIPYPETKTYVKKVFRSYWNYIRLYSGNN